MPLLQSQRLLHGAFQLVSLFSDASGFLSARPIKQRHGAHPPARWRRTTYKRIDDVDCRDLAVDVG